MFVYKYLVASLTSLEGVSRVEFLGKKKKESESFLISQLFAAVGQIIGTSALASILPMNIQV